MLAYVDAPSGVAGDMLVGALVDAGWPASNLTAVVASLGLTREVSLAVGRVHRGPIEATRVEVTVTGAPEHRRHLPDILERIHGAELAPEVAGRAEAAFQALAEAEARIHGGTPESVHLHETSAADALVDVVAAAQGLYDLGVGAVYASPLPLGSGWVDSEHGRIPIPAPATLALLSAVGAPTVPDPGPGAGELVTPTGAAMLAAWARFQRPAMTMTASGSGAGKRETAWPNVVRLWLGEATDLPAPTAVCEIEANIDDMLPEHMPPLMERLLALGALDVVVTPCLMKKGRPGLVLSVVCEPEMEAAMVNAVFEGAPTLGLRARAARRHVADRRIVTIATRYGSIRMKLKLVGGQVTGMAPEFEDCRRAADAAGAPLGRVWSAAIAAGEQAVEAETQ